MRIKQTHIVKEIENQFGEKVEILRKVHELGDGQYIMEKSGKVGSLKKISQEEFEKLEANGTEF